MKIIKVSTELEMSVHEFPEGTMREQNKVLYGLIGNGCDLVEHVMPKRLYTELKMPSSPVKEPGKCVSMLIDEEGRLKPNKANLIGSYLYEFDKHGCPIVGNILFIGEKMGDDGVEFCGISEENFSLLETELKNMITAMKATVKEIDRMRGFFKEWSTEKDVKDWTAVTRFQDMVKQRRLDEKHAKETNPIDIVMGTVKEIPEGFKKWVSEKAMSFSRYLIYSARSKNEALVRCTHCNEVTLVDRTKIRLRNNEKGICPLCGSPVTIKARSRMPAHICDSRIVSFIEPREEGFLWRYFTAYREVKPDGKINDGLFEIVRTFYKFAPNGTPCTNSYEYRDYKQTGIVRWCTDEGYKERSYCTLYPGNLPEAWKDTPMKYSALEILAENRPSEQIHYAKAINRYRKFPQLEWFIKMGLYKLAAHLINEFHDGAFGYESRNGIRGLRKSGKTIFEILGLTKENTRILQSIDGNIDELRLLQEAQSSGYNLKAEELERFYKLFGCNTTLIRKENRKSTIHKICRYIEREGADYRVGESGQCWRYSYMQRKERPDIREERLQNCAKDWLDYLNWCKELKYDLNNMFFYFPKNFKKVHDRTAAEYQALQDKKAAEGERRKNQKTQTRKSL